MNKRFTVFTHFLILIVSITLKAQNTTYNIQDFDAIHYEIKLTEVNTAEKTLTANTNIKAVCLKNDINKVCLELLSLNVDSVFVNNVRNNNYTHVDGVLTVNFSQNFQQNDTVNILVCYHGTPFVDLSGWGGFHFAGDFAFNLGVGFSSIPHNLGKAWFPCFDNFTDRALFDVLITTSNDKQATSGGFLYDTFDNGNGTTTWHWKTAHTLPTYLISASIGKYFTIEDSFVGQYDTVPITFTCRAGDTAKIASTFVNLKEITSIFENCFGPYPFERIGLTATANGAMEHAANISYPYSGWSGNTDLEWWYAHELSHMWFGDAVTCSSAGHMWLNEGWAVWCESLYKEFLYGKDAYKNNMRKKLKDVLLKTHKTDGGYYALYDIPETLTYGSTVYDKGGQVVHTLRNYLGDSIFFDAVKEYINTYKYSHASSDTLKNFLTLHTGIDMTSFFETWVESPGFPHFSIDSIVISPTCPHSEVEVTVRQRLKELPNYANDNHVEITFVSDTWEFYSDTIVFSGATGNKKFYMPFEPVSVMLDYNEKISDATTDEAIIIKQVGTYNFPETFMSINTTNITDSALVRVTHNWVAPDSLKNGIEGLRLSDTRYWTIEGIFPDGFVTSGKFPYTKTQGFELNLTQNRNDSIVMLYRVNASKDWSPINFNISGTWMGGNITIDTLKPGEYTFAAWDYNYLNTDNSCINKEEKSIINIYPNPTSEHFNIVSNYKGDGCIKIFDTEGKLVFSQKYAPEQLPIKWQPNSSVNSNYIIVLYDKNGKIIDSRKAVYSGK